MNAKDQLAQHTSQISRLEQVMTALAEAQVKGEEQTAELRHAMIALAKAQLKTQWQAYINTLPRN